jgi:hypothetical protein
LGEGIYIFECWGATGGVLQTSGGRGSYVSGRIKLNYTTNFFLFVGEKGVAKGTEQTFNGGGGTHYNASSTVYKHAYSSSGGGSTDIRLSGGPWDSFESLKTRIMVAAGGGGESNYVSNSNINVGNPQPGGNGGSLVGEDGNYSMCVNCQTNSSHISATGGQQQKGGAVGGYYPRSCGYSNGKFGIGGKACYDKWPSSGGGGGYFGGGGGGVTTHRLGTGAGGSSFVSGYSLCSAITENSTSGYITFNGSVHYSGLFFTNIV